MSTELLNINVEKKDDQPTIIKVIGVGGGGGNAVNYMYNQNIPHVSYLLCNTDRQHLHKCNVPNTIVLGEKITRGLGAGNKPEVAREAAEESREEIDAALSDGTEMVFITAGMGGGTGTGAAPVIARIAKDKGILTVGIVTIPFIFEGRVKILQAIKGVEELSKNVDAILVVKNELLYSVYPDLNIEEAFKKADEILTNSTRSISEMITLPGIINVDLNDVRTTLSNGGVSIISRGFATSAEGLKVAMERALSSPLVNTSSFDKASTILIQVTYHKDHIPNNKVMEDLNKVTARIKNQFNLIWGLSSRDDLEDELGVTLLASGFDKSILELDEYTGENDQEKIRERQEEENKVLTSYYPELDVVNSGYTSYHSAIFTEQELDDNNFIAFISETPTLLRKEDELNKRRKMSEAQVPLIPSYSAEPATSPVRAPEFTTDDPDPVTLDSRHLEDEVDDTLIRFGN